MIGGELVKQCHEKQITVHYLTTSKEKIKNEPHYKGFYWNPENNEIDTAAFNDVAVVVNLSGVSISHRWTKNNKKKILESRTSSANLIYETLQKIQHNVFHYISASGINIYPNSKSRLYTENDKKVDDSFLAEVVVAWEAAADQFKNLNIKVAKIRTGVVFGEEGTALQKIEEPIKKGFGTVLGSGRQWLSWIHLRDIAGIYLHTITNGLEGVYNAVAPNPVTNKKLTKCLAVLHKKSIWLPNAPGFMLRLILGEMATLVLEGQLVSSKKIEGTGYNFQFVNIQYALRDLI